MTNSDPRRTNCFFALAIARDDASRIYEDLTQYRVEAHLENDGWHVEYRFQGIGRFHTGGGPHYLIDAQTGAILHKTYYQ